MLVTLDQVQTGEAAGRVALVAVIVLACVTYGLARAALHAALPRTSEHVARWWPATVPVWLLVAAGLLATGGVRASLAGAAITVHALINAVVGVTELPRPARRAAGHRRSPGQHRRPQGVAA
jgi:hypothetical protein